MNKSIEMEKLWSEKRGRRDTNAGLALYIALNSPQIDPLAIISATINELAENPKTGLAWSQDFGRIIVAVNPIAENLVSLQKIDDSTKGYVRIETTKLIDPIDVLGPKFGDGRNKVYLNARPLTIEGLTLQIARSVDEVVWNSNTRKSIRSYAEAVNQVRSEGLEIYPIPEDEILNLKRKYGRDFPVRLYGSGAIKTMPTIICGVARSKEKRCFPILKPVDKLDTFPKLEKRETKLEGETSAAIWVTLGKRLNVGHLFTTCIADLIKRGCGGKGELVIASNDTGPRIAALITSLSVMLSQPVAETAKRLRDGLIDPEQIVLAYRQRNEDLVEPGALLEAVKGGGILRAMEDLAIEDLSQAGFSNLKLIRESESDQTKIAQVNPEWAGYGFLPANSGNRLSILARKGELTAIGQGLALSNAALAGINNFVLVDSDIATTCIAEISQSLGKRVAQVFGSGVSIEGKLGSGTSGELPTIQELTSVFGERLSEIARFYVLTQPQLVIGGKVLESSFDFSSREDIFRALQSCSENLDSFKLRVRQAKNKLRAIPDTSQEIPNEYTARIQYLPARLEQLTNPSSQWVVDTMKRPKRISDKGGQFLVKRKNPYYSELVRDLNLIENTNSLLAQDATMLGQIIDICMERIGGF